jgi:asparagine synthase (glutamine-hydrolysing)
LSTLSLKKYFGYGYIPAPRTIWENVWKLPAGHSLWLNVAEPACPRVEAYWKFVLEPVAITDARQAAQRTEALRAAIERAVIRRLAADVPTGVFLSGGLDSSLVTALAAKNLPAGALQTFCIGFEEASFDESRYAHQVAKHCHTQHHEDRLSVEHARTLLPEIIAKLDEPMGDSSLLPTALLARFARQRVKVALGGDGGDELFAGYDPFRALHTASAYARWMPRLLHAGISAMVDRLPVSHRNMSFDFKLKRFLRGANQSSSLWLPTWMAPLSSAEVGDLFAEPIEPEELFSEAVSAWEECAQTDLVDRTLQFYVQLYLQDDILVKVDRASMMFGLEVQAPLLDIEVVNLARQIPSDWKFRRGDTKHLLKRVAAPLLPAEIVHRSKKGFGMPVGAWFQRGSLRIENPPINSVFTQRLQAEHRAGRGDHRAFLWNMWLLEQWKESHAA